MPRGVPARTGIGIGSTEPKDGVRFFKKASTGRLTMSNQKVPEFEVAEEEGFEPPSLFHRTLVFETSPVTNRVALPNWRMGTQHVLHGSERV